MTAREANLSATLRSTPFAVALALAGVAMIAWECDGTTVPDLTALRSFLLPSPNLWFAGSPATGCFVNLACLAAVAMLMVWINARFSVVRDYSATFIGFFLVMTAATPIAVAAFTGATMLALVVLAAVAMLMSVYSEPRLSRRIFLAFYVVAVASFTQYAFVAYAVIFVAGLIQLRAFTERSLTAALLGIAAAPLPAICLALWLGIGGLRRPEIVNIYQTWAGEDIVRLWVTVGFTIALGSALGIVNLLKIYSLNARSRALNGLLSTVSFITAAMAVIDFTNMPVYIVLLNALTAFQANYFMKLYERRRSYLLVLALPVVYVGFFAWMAAV